MNSSKDLSIFCSLLLTVISFFVAGLTIIGSIPWALIFIYWLVMACKNICDFFGDIDT